ncbi:hypothetical protein [Celeribacter arenosi]|uniref:50S ribosomal protein L35 n=1 Tax=Celeribacter arenosi TaxID=792649 RepID=A0ABP7K0W5_9RHOB
MNSLDTDLFLVLGSIIALLSVPAVIGAFSDSRPPRAAAILLMLGGGLIVLAITQHPGGYTITDLPDTVYRVIGRIF